MDSLFRFKKVIPVAVISCTQYNRFIVSPMRTYVFIYRLKEKTCDIGLFRNKHMFQEQYVTQANSSGTDFILKNIQHLKTKGERK